MRRTGHHDLARLYVRQRMAAGHLWVQGECGARSRVPDQAAARSSEHCDLVRQQRDGSELGLASRYYQQAERGNREADVAGLPDAFQRCAGARRGTLRAGNAVLAKLTERGLRRYFRELSVGRYAQLERLAWHA